ncbi:9766_t:CDS:2, partial [Racocetra persica]
ADRDILDIIINDNCLLTIDIVPAYYCALTKGKCLYLMEAECFTVEKLKKEGMSAAKIARILGRSDTSVKNCLK